MIEKSLALKNIKAPPSLKDMAFQAIKDAILNNKLMPGILYNEQRIARELGISKTPVREALIDLSARGFLTYVPRKGIHIKILTKKEIRDLFEFRIVIEKAVIRKVTPSLTGECIQKIESIRLKDIEAAERNDRFMFLKVDREFHTYLSSLTDNQDIVSALENIRDLIDWTGIKILERKERMAEALEEHGAIIEMLKKRDTQGAIAMMENHIKITEQRVLSQISH